ncbi:MAG TPA: hypothetical protein VF101_09310 [Gaiellaceae bacterium]
MARDLNPFQISGPVKPAEMIDREDEAGELFDLADGGHSSRLVAPRRYGKSSLLGKVLSRAQDAGMPTAHVDLMDVLTLGAIVTRFERGYNRALRGPIRSAASDILKTWKIGVSLGGGGFAVKMSSNPRIDAESVLLKLLELPTRLAEKSGIRSVLVLDEIQDILNVEGADGILRSVIQYQADDASYLFAGSSPSLMAKVFSDPSRPFLDHALPMELGPLPDAASAEHISQRFAASGRDAGVALDPLIEFARGHPQRTMLLAHHLWAVTPRGSRADEGAWLQALKRSFDGAKHLLRARYEALPTNEKRLMIALAIGHGTIYEAKTLAAVGLKRGSVAFTLDALEGRAEVVRVDGRPVVADPLFEHWLQEKGAF